MSERCEGMSERRSERPDTLRVDFIVILPLLLTSPHFPLLLPSPSNPQSILEVNKAGYTATDASVSAFLLIPACECVPVPVCVRVFRYPSSLRLC